MIRRKHSKLCLRQISSRSTLLSEDRHSKVCIRNRGQRLRNRLHSIFTILSTRSERQDYFTGRLPAEIRLMIYGYALCFDRPVSLDRNPKRGLKSKKARILLVNRLTYAEALPVLYELNTILISREEFCHYPTGKRPQLIIKPELVERLYVRDLAGSSRCAKRAISPWLDTNRPCMNCTDSLIGFINTLRHKPRLKKVTIDYHGYHHAVKTLVENTVYPPEMQVTCTGIGRYQLTGRLLLRIKFELLDVPIVAVWKRLLECPSRYPNASNAHVGRLVWRDLKWLECKMEPKDLVMLVLKMSILVMQHDINYVPASLATIWPQDLPMDFRTVETLATSQFLHDFNVQLQHWLDTGPLLLQDLVMRRP